MCSKVESLPVVCQRASKSSKHVSVFSFFFSAYVATSERSVPTLFQELGIMLCGAGGTFSLIYCPFCYAGGKKLAVARGSVLLFGVVFGLKQSLLFAAMLPLVSPQKASKQEAQAAIRPEAQGWGGTALMESKAIKSQANRYWEDEDDGDEKKSTRQ